jgi:hypothetical protein
MIESVNLDIGAPPAEIEAVKQAFRHYGFDVDPKGTYITRSVDLTPWLVAVTITAPITAFFAAFAGEAGKDAYAAVRAWVREVWASRAESPRPPGSLELEDPDGTRLILWSRISDHALDALSTIDWEQERGSYLMWDEEQGVWRDPTAS